jgi:hypothetical protein
MSWSLAAVVSEGQDVDTRLEEATHEVRDSRPNAAGDIVAAVEAARVIAARFEKRPITVDMFGHEDRTSQHWVSVRVST